MLKNCLRCKKSFYTKPSRVLIGRGKFCSKKCSSLTQRNRVKRKCVSCNNFFYLKLSASNKVKIPFCNKECKRKFKTHIIKCGVCQKSFSTYISLKRKKFCSDTCRYKANEGTKRSLSFRKKRTGKMNPNWQGGRKVFASRIRGLTEYLTWRKKVMQRDKFTCQSCGQVGRELNVDHIVPFSYLLKEFKISSIDEAINCSSLWKLDNGRTLCVSCHKKTDTYLVKAIAYAR